MPTPSFYDYFSQNMANVGLEAPKSLFESKEKALATISAIATAVSTFGKSVTVAEIALAGSGLEILVALGALTASFYLGVCIGSFIMAAGSYVSDRVSYSDFLRFVERYKISLPSSMVQLSYHQYTEREILLNTRATQYA